MLNWAKVDWWMYAGRWRRQRKDYEGALRCFVRASEIDPDHASAHVLTGYCLHTLGRNEEAITVLDRALRLEPSNGAAHAYRSLCLAARGEYQAAYESLERALRMTTLKKPGDIAYWHGQLRWMYASAAGEQAVVEHCEKAGEHEAPKRKKIVEEL